MGLFNLHISVTCAALHRCRHACARGCRGRPWSSVRNGGAWRCVCIVRGCRWRL